MKARASLLAALTLVVAAAVVFRLFQSELHSTLFALGAQPEVREALEGSLEDLKTLSRLDPASEAAYRARFRALEPTVRRLQILDYNRDSIMTRYEAILLSAFAAIVLALTAAHVVSRQRNERRLTKLELAIADLARGETAVTLDDRRRDSIGRMGRMVERTSRVMAKQRRRLDALGSLTRWQDAARRLAHEMRTPLTGLQLQLTRIRDLAAEWEGTDDPRAAGIRGAGDDALGSLNRLADFTRQFTSLAQLPAPILKRQDLRGLLRDFVDTYASAWPGLALELAAPRSVPVDVDRDLIRQVLVNLCANSSQALAGRPGRVTFHPAAHGDVVILEVTDDGPGVPPDIVRRMFEPYISSRDSHRGMGLGLAISRKILLDHGGDLDLHDTGRQGTTFHLILPKPPDRGAGETA